MTSLNTTQKINTYYDLYKTTEITFNKEVINTTGLISKQVYLKYSGKFMPCIVYSCSMTSARVLVNIDEGFFKAIKDKSLPVYLRFCFTSEKKGNPMAFFIITKVSSFTPYKGQGKELYFLNLDYSQRPTNVLIGILGDLLDAHASAQKRSDERITITNDSIKKMNITAKNTLVYIQKIPRKCLLRDFSFSGAKILLMGNPKFLIDKPVELVIPLNEELIKIKGTFIRFEAVEGRKDISSLGINYDIDQVPLQYKVLLNTYFQSRH